MIRLNINGEDRDIDMEPDTPLLWALRDGLRLTGTKYGCGIAQCGSCVVLADSKPIRSCVTPISSLGGKQIITIEGLSPDRSHPVQQAWITEEVPQCGYCQSGQILSTVALLEANPSPSDAEIDDALGDVLCRCGTYPRIRKAIKSLSVQIAQQDKEA